MLRSGDHLRPRDFKSFPGKTGHKTLSGRDLPSDGATFPGQHWVGGQEDMIVDVLLDLLKSKEKDAARKDPAPAASVIPS